jgi:hypothetical protein
MSRRENARWNIEGVPMTVHAEGYCWVMEQLKEKQDFESELSRLGYRHENFTLRVRRARPDVPGNEWSANYFVRVTETRTLRSNVYVGGPRGRWVEQFSTDLATGVFGEPGIAHRARGASYQTWRSEHAKRTLRE